MSGLPFCAASAAPFLLAYIVWHLVGAWLRRQPVPRVGDVWQMGHVRYYITGLRGGWFFVRCETTVNIWHDYFFAADLADLFRVHNACLISRGEP